MSRAKPKATDTKVEFQGDVVIVTKYDERQFFGFKSQGGRKKGGSEHPERQAEYRKQAIYRARKQIQTIIRTNFSVTDSFLTLTFRPGALQDPSNLDECKQAVSAFIHSLQRRFTDLKYVVTFEMQRKRSVPTLHAHMVANLPMMPYDEILELWPFADVVDIRMINRTIRNLAAYMVKEYSTRIKDCIFLHYIGKKTYLSSKYLSKPEVYRGNDAKNILRRFNKYELEYKGIEEYDSKYCGKVRQITYERDPQPRKKAKRKTDEHLLRKEKKKLKVEQIKQLLINNPGISQRKIGNAIGLSSTRVNQLMQENNLK